MKTFVLGVLALAVVAAAASPVHAAGRTRVAVLEIRIEGDAAPELRDQLDKSLAGGLHKAGYDVVSRAQVARKLESSPELVGCTTTTCLEAIGDRVGASRFVRVRVSATGAAYTVELELLAADVTTGPIARMEKSCAPCTFDEANEMMSNAATELHEGVGTKVPVRVSTDPPGAEIELDGKAVGTAPLDLDVLPGDHVFRAKLAGRADAQVTSSVTRQTGGDAQIVALSLPTGPAAVMHEDADAPGPYRVWKWTAAGGAFAAVASGIWLIAIDGDATGCPPGPGQCPDYYDTMLGGVTLTLTGVALGGLATWLFLEDHPREASAVAAQPVAGGGMLYFRRTF
jgi:PEGA domain